MKRRKNPAKEPTATTAILETPQADGVALTLFDMEAVTQALERGAPLAKPAVLGFINAHIPELGTPPGQEFDPAECAGAWQVGTAVSVKGWGPLLYDALLGWAADHPRTVSGIMPSWSIAPSAKEVWSYYANWRPDVESFALPPSCVRHEKEPYLDQVYVAEDAGLYRELAHRGRDYVRAEAAFGRNLPQELHDAGMRMFLQHMDEQLTRRWAGR